MTPISTARGLPRGVTRIEHLRARCDIDHATHCWLWRGASTKAKPRIYTLDHARGEKRPMSGPLAAWNIAHGAAPLAGALVYRCCGHQACLNPAHLREALSKAEIGLHIRRSGQRKGTALESRRANIRLAQAASGVVFTSPDVVRLIRAAGADVSSRALARKTGASDSVVSRIRRGQSHRGVA